MNKKSASKTVEVLKNYWKQMTENEISWIVFQVVGNVPLDKLQALVKEWYAKGGNIKDAEEWVKKSL